MVGVYMSYVLKGGAYANEDRYAQVFMRAYKELSEMERTIVYKTKVEGDNRLYPEYLLIVAKLASKVFDEDEELGILVYRKMLPNIELKSDEEIKEYNKKMKSKIN